MITAQDIRGRTFEKAVFGGYDMTAVDDFLSEVANDLTLLQKENAVLKSKMKVLVDKIGEYRENEDALHMAVVSAQKLGSAIEQEAREKAEVILANARQEASETIGGANAAAEAEKLRQDEVRRSSAKFIDNMEMLCRKQLDFLRRVGELDFVKALRELPSAPAEGSAPEVPAPPAEQAAPAPETPASAPVAPAQAEAPARPAEIHETVKSIEETVARVMDEPVVNVRPELRQTLAVDERPTRPFNVISDAEDDVSRAVLFHDGQ